MLNVNYNIIGAFGKSNIGAGPDIQPTTTTTTTTTSTTTTTTTTGTVQVRTDPYSASLVLAIPGAYFGATFGQESFRSDISSYIRGTGVSVPDNQLPFTSSFTGSASGSITSSVDLIKWNTYPASTAVTGAIALDAIGTLKSTLQFPTGDYTFETWIAYATSSDVTSAYGLINGQIFYHYQGTGLLSNGITDGDPGVRFLITTEAGADIYFDSAILPRSASAWYHIGGQRSGSLFSSLWSGSAVQSFTYSGTLNTGSASTQFWIMGTPTDSYYKHYYQDFRIYKGIGKYSNQTSGSTYTMPDSMVI